MSVESIQRTWSEDELAEAVRDHFRLGVIAVGHVVPRGAVHVTDHAVMGHVGHPSIFNRATALSVDQPDVALSEVETFFAGLPHSLWLDADAVGGDVDELLRGRGYVPLPPQHGMVCEDLTAADAAVDPEVHAELVTTPASASDIAAVSVSGFGLGVDDRLILEDLARAVLRHARPWDHGAVYVVRDADRVIASTGSLLCTKEVAGISGLATRPSWRHHHAATAIVSRAMTDARALGASLATSIATPDSEHTLARLGFRTVIDYRVYRQVQR